MMVVMSAMMMMVQWSVYTHRQTSSSLVLACSCRRCCCCVSCCRTGTSAGHTHCPAHFLAYGAIDYSELNNTDYANKQRECCFGHSWRQQQQAVDRECATTGPHLTVVHFYNSCAFFSMFVIITISLLSVIAVVVAVLRQLATTLAPPIVLISIDFAFSFSTSSALLMSDHLSFAADSIFCPFLWFLLFLFFTLSICFAIQFGLIVHLSSRLAPTAKVIHFSFCCCCCCNGCHWIRTVSQCKSEIVS